CSTASTCAIESFQRKPKGGNSSSTEYALAAEKKRAMTPVERIRRIALLFQLEARFAFQFSVFACVARIFLIGILVALWKRENCVHESIRSNQEWHMATQIGSIASPQRLPCC